MTSRPAFEFPERTPEEVARYAKNWSADPTSFAVVLERVRDEFKKLFKDYYDVVEFEGQKHAANQCVVPIEGVTPDQVREFVTQLSRLADLEDGANRLLKESNPRFAEVPRALFNPLIVHMRDAVDAGFKGWPLGHLDEAFDKFERDAMRIAESIRFVPGSWAVGIEGNGSTDELAGELKRTNDDDERSDSADETDLTQVLKQGLEEELRGQQLQLLRFLWGESQWTNFNTLKEKREFWRGCPDSSDVMDCTVFQALKRLRTKLTQIENSRVSLTIEQSNHRTKLEGWEGAD